jgi:ADP-ribosylglycohydrolase
MSVYYEYMKHLESVGDALLTAVAYGDAAGLPVETKSAGYIAKKYGYIDHLIAPTENPFYGGDLPAGSWSDDTQLSLTIASALVKADGFDILSIARAHIEAYDQTPEVVSENGKVVKRGWGGSTTRSIERMINGISPSLAGEKGGAGNGILMKLSPLVFWQVARHMSDEQRYTQYDQLTTMTHDSDVARVCTRVHGDVLQYLLSQEYDAVAFINYVIDSAEYHESHLKTNHDTSQGLHYLQQNNQPSSSQILQQFDNPTSGFKYGFYAPETLAIVYGAFMSHAPDFNRAVYAAVNIGGDSDSTASIVASMIHFLCNGEQTLPDDCDKIVDSPLLQKVSRELTTLALRTAL